MRGGERLWQGSPYTRVRGYAKARGPELRWSSGWSYANLKHFFQHAVHRGDVARGSGHRRDSGLRYLLAPCRPQAGRNGCNGSLLVQENGLDYASGGASLSAIFEV